MEVCAVFRIFVNFDRMQYFYTDFELILTFKTVTNKFDKFAIFHQKL